MEAINNWSSLTVSGTAAVCEEESVCGGSKPISLPSFSSSNTLVATARFNYAGGGGDLVASLVDANQSGTNWLPGFGISGQHSYIRDVVQGSYNEHSGSTTFAGGDYYDVQLTVNLSTAGGLATFASRDFTLGQTAFTTDSSLVNVPLGLTKDGARKV